MAQGENKEIEILIRGLARRAGKDIRLRDDSPDAAPDSRLQSGAHLDADEANSYAEGRLPAPARARYTAHIADCADCRSLVAQLVIALGPITRQPDDVVAVSWWQKFTALFTPSVMRYAMPAVVLTVAVVLGLFIWRNQSQSRLAGELVATRTSNEKAVTQETQIKSSDGSLAQPAEPMSQNKPAAREEPHVSPPKSEAAKVEDKKASAAAPVEGADEERTAARKDDGEPTARPVAATKATAPAPPVTQPKTAELSKEQQAKNAEEPSRDADNYQAQKREAQKTAVNDATSRQRGPSANVSNQVVGRKAKVAPGDQARGGGGDSVGGARRSENETDTRSVAGRRFRREGDVWVDTAYDQSQAIVNVTRGSEQFRALVADEPEIGRIAAQLGGEVIVVWKSRAYRIR